MRTWSPLPSSLWFVPVLDVIVARLVLLRQIVFSEPNVPGSTYSVYNNGSHLELVGSDMNAPMGVKLGYRHFYA